MLTIRPATADDAAAVCDIYNHYIRHTVVTFEEEVLETSEIARRMTEVADAGLPWLVAETEAGVIGYAYAGKWRGRCSYRFSVETSIYLRQGCEGQGTGSRLYTGLLEKLCALNLHCAIGGMAEPNAGCQALHEKFGFQKVAHFQEVGWKMDRWIDVSYWELILN